MTSMRPRSIAISAASLAGALCGVVYCFPPASHSFYPRCPLYMLTGWQCPGCGATRALYELLHGNIGAAWAYNQLFVALFPMLVITFAVQLCYFARHGRWYVLPGQQKLVYAALIVAVCFGVARNFFPSLGIS